jgi:Zn-dependent peptidase ImmA (M78 family)
LPLLGVAQALYALLTDGIAYLASSCPHSERIGSLKRSIVQIPSSSERRLAWLLGFGSSIEELLTSCNRLRESLGDLRPEARASILGTPGEVSLVAPSFSAALMFGSVSPHLDMSDRIKLVRALAEAYQPDHNAPLSQLVQDVPVDTMHPWKQGYDLATEILQDLQLDSQESGAVDVERILRDQGVMVGQIALNDRSIRAVAIGGAQYRPTVLVNKLCRFNEYPTGRRFSLAHEFCHLIFDAAYSRDVAIASGDWAPNDIEERANALAAMLLMPPARLQSALAQVHEDTWTESIISNIANELQTSFTATVQHLHNLGYFGDAQRDALLSLAHDSRGNEEV